MPGTFARLTLYFVVAPQTPGPVFHNRKTYVLSGICLTATRFKSFPIILDK